MSSKPSEQGKDSAAVKTAPKLEEIFARAQGVRLLALDVDGVLTDGALYFTDSGEEMKAFSTLDGQGIKLLQQNGVAVALISARNSQLVNRRAANLGINHVVQGSEHKLQALQELLQGLQLDLSQVAYVGDDLPDLACIRRVVLGIAVANAHAAVKSAAFCITNSSGGRGAVREVCDWILQAQGSYEAAVARFY
jgi:3-deoxy-D-manno-octulosonate 8-phosphate phosphatase (KDO 8-P phosphatase)